jgi:hypothetical protein
MKIEIIGEDGYNEALYGLGLSYGLTSGISYNGYIKDIELLSKLKDISYKLSKREGGHNKFLETITMRLLINAPRYWWSEADTYRISTKQSESTMHTLMKNPITQDLFEQLIDCEYIKILEKMRVDNNFKCLKNYIPEGFLQSRVWVLSYKTLRNIISQRRKHKLEQWKQFCDHITTNAKHKEFLDDLKY